MCLSAVFNVSVLEDVTYWLVRWSALRQLYYLVGDDESFGVVLVFTGFACVCGLSVHTHSEFVWSAHRVRPCMSRNTISH